MYNTEKIKPLKCHEKQQIQRPVTLCVWLCVCVRTRVQPQAQAHARVHLYLVGWSCSGPTKGNSFWGPRLHPEAEQSDD